MPSLSTRRPSGGVARAKKPPPPALLSGYLNKVKSQKKNFLSKTNRRFFVADARTERLLYYKKLGAKLPQGGVPLDDIEEVRTGRRDDEFEVMACTRQFILRAESAKECAVWIEALREHVAYARAYGRATLASGRSNVGRTARSVSPVDSTSVDDSERPASSASAGSASSPASSMTPRVVRATSSAASSPEDSHGRWNSGVGGSERSSPEVEEKDAERLREVNARVSRIVQPRASAIARGPSLQNGRVDDECASPAQQQRPTPSPVAMQVSSRNAARRTHSISSKKCDSPAGPTVERFVCTVVSPPSALAPGRSGRRAGGKRRAVTPATSELVLSDTESECDSPLPRSFSPVGSAPNGRSFTRGDERAASKWDEEEEDDDEAVDEEEECATGGPAPFVDGPAVHAARRPTVSTPTATRHASSSARAGAGKEATPDAAGVGTPGVYRDWDSSDESSVCASPPAARALSGASSKVGVSSDSANKGGAAFHPYVSAHRTSARSPAAEPRMSGSPAAFNSWDSDDM